MEKFIRRFVTAFVLISLPLLSLNCTHIPPGKIAFDSTRGDSEHGYGIPSLYVTNPDGSNQIKVGPLLGRGGGPWPSFCWSPDGTKIAFSSTEIRPHRDWLCVVNADGANLTKLVKMPPGVLGGISWSPDGRRIAFGWFDGYTRDIYTLDFDTYELKNLTATPDMRESWPSWSPDGKKFAFNAYLIDPATYEITYSSVCLMDANTGKQTTLVIASDPRTLFYDWPLAWAPDGEKILYLSIFYEEGKYANGDICLIDIKTGEEVNLTNSLDIHDFLPSWSPDGKKIVFVSGPWHDQEIYVIDADGSNLTRLTNGPRSKGFPSWSPDGKKIVFTVAGSGVSTDDIYIMDANGSNVINLTSNTPGDDYWCIWSPR